MPSNNKTSEIQQARASIDALRLTLLSPDPAELGGAIPGLEAALRDLEALSREIRQGASAPIGLHRELMLLKNDLRISGRLIEHGAAFWRGWAKLVGAGPSYTQSGHSAPPEAWAGCGGTLSLRG
jgi:hypothetical protein